MLRADFRYYSRKFSWSVRDFIARYLTHRCPACRMPKGLHKMQCYHVY
jgi:hypothetical protein